MGCVCCVCAWVCNAGTSVRSDVLCCEKTDQIVYFAAGEWCWERAMDVGVGEVLIACVVVECRCGCCARAHKPTAATLHAP